MKQNNTYIFLLRKDYILYEKEKNLYNKHVIFCLGHYRLI